MASFFIPKHSSAATARLTEQDPDTSSSPPTKSKSSRPSPTKSRSKHRRLESDTMACWPDNEEEEPTNDRDDANALESLDSHEPTKSTSFSSDSEDDDDDDDSDDYDSDNDNDAPYKRRSPHPIQFPIDSQSILGGTTETMDGYSLTDGLGSEFGDCDDRFSVMSGSSTGSSGTNNSILNSMMNNGEYTGDDMDTLNALVNKLHARELASSRERNTMNGHGGIHTNTNTNSSSSPPPSPIDMPSELPQDQPPPHFSPLQSSHRLSISAVDSWRGQSLEVVPTEDVDHILPLWNDQWDDDRKEWQERTMQISSSLDAKKEFVRSRTHHAGGGGSSSNNYYDEGKFKAINQSVGFRRNHSMPNANSPISKASHHSSHPHSTIGPSSPSSSPFSKSLPTTTTTTAVRHYKYGKPPTLPHAKNPNPMVSKSSKRITKKHARYALTAGMMLGIRESVGGAMSIENELEVENWRCWEEKECCLEEEEDGGGEGEEVNKNDGNTDGKNCEESDTERQQSTTTEPQTSAAAPSTNNTTTSSSPSRPNLFSAATTLTSECERVSKYKFPPHQFYLGSNTSKPLPHKYKFKVYAPLVFARIRSLFGVEKQTFLHSICGKFNFYEFASNARSGQFFFYSHDGRYMIKTLTPTESKFLREILPYYYRHLQKNPDTFLTHFYGMYRVCMPNANNQRLHFIIMRSVFHTEKKIDRVWDLKGSKAGRRADEGDGVQKDLDILEEGRKLRFSDPGARKKFLDQLARDATFLARLGIMDYSLLLGLHKCEEEGESSSGYVGVDDAAEAPSTPRENQRTEGQEAEPERSNTPFRRCVLQRASSMGDTKVGNNGFKALEAGGDRKSKEDNETNGKSMPRRISSSALNSIPETPMQTSYGQSTLSSSSATKNAITSRSDGGIDGYGIKLEDGTLAKKEIYFCGVIDILQYYNARKVGETVLRKATGNAGEDISCVDPETYGKRFVKFISNLVDK